jgi:hypothetical protein
MSNAPVVLIEVVLVFGSVLAWCLWELHSMKKDTERKKRPRGE